MSSFLLGLIAFLVILGPLILIHEFGHFIAARLIGVTVLEFGIGFPPRAFKLFTQGGTEFTVNWLPIGGFVRPLGEDFVRPIGADATAEERAEFERRQGQRKALESRAIKTKSIAEAGPWQRIFFMAAGIGMNLLVGFGLFTLIALTGTPSLQRADVTPTEVKADSFFATAGIKPNDVIKVVNGVQILSPELLDLAVCQSAVLKLPLHMNILRGGTMLAINTAAPPLTNGGLTFTDVTSGQPAATAGLQKGDQITSLNGQAVCATADLLAQEHTLLGQAVTVSILRGGKPQDVNVKLNPQFPALGASIQWMPYWAGGGLTAITDENPVYTYTKLGLGDAIGAGLNSAWNVISNTLNLPLQLIRGQISPADARPASVVGISQMGAQVIQQSIDTQQSFPLINFAALISIAIGFTQLLPIPGLDGGRILFVVIELIRRKPMSPEREGLVHLTGLLILLGLMVVLVVNDVINPIVLPR